MRASTTSLLLITAVIPQSAVPAVVSAKRPGPGVTVTGFIGESPTTPASGELVRLLDAKTGKKIASDETNFLGKYKFKKVPPGSYILRIRKIRRKLIVGQKKVRLDVDLSAPSGKMNYAKPSLKEFFKKLAPKPRTQEEPKKPRSPRPAAASEGTARLITGVWWGYSGSTESKIALCSNGTYRDYSESSYSGNSRNSLGNQTMAWGSANQEGGDGTWSVTGNAQQGSIHVTYRNGNRTDIPYRKTEDPGCFLMGGRTLCRTQARCR